MTPEIGELYKIKNLQEGGVGWSGFWMETGPGKEDNCFGIYVNEEQILMLVGEGEPSFAHDHDERVYYFLTAKGKIIVEYKFVFSKWLELVEAGDG